MPGVETSDPEFEGDSDIFKGDAANIRASWLGKKLADIRSVGVIKPTFDWSLSPNDTAFKSSYGSCYRSEISGDGKPHLAPIGKKAHLYEFIKIAENRYVTIVAPSTLDNTCGASDANYEDAFADLRKYIRRALAGAENFDDQVEYYLVGNFAKRLDPIVPKKAQRWVLNVARTDKEHKWVDEVLIVGSAAYDDLVESIRDYRASSSSDKLRDENNPDFLIGDVTRPDKALIWQCGKRVLGTMKEPANVLDFLSIPGRLTDPQGAPTYRETTISPEALSKRVNFFDAGTWNVLSYQEQVDFIVDHMPAVPMEYIRGAFSTKSVVKERTESASIPSSALPSIPQTHSPGMPTAPPSSPGIPPVPEPPSMPSPPAQTPPPPTPVSPPPPPERSIVVYHGGAVKAVVESEARRLAAADSELQVIDPDGDPNAWVQASTVFKQDVPPPPPTAAPAHPSAPPAGATPPADEPVQPVAPDAGSVDLNVLLPNYKSLLSAEELAKAEEVAKALNTPNQNLTPEQSDWLSNTHARFAQ